MSNRVRRYTITMAFRMACFLGLFFVDGWARWALLAGAVFLPYVAVLFANQANQRGKAGTVTPGAPSNARQLTASADDSVVTGEVVDEPSRADRPSPWARPTRDEQQDRVA